MSRRNTGKHDDRKELNLRAGLAAFSDADRVVPVNLDQFDPLNSRDDLIKLLVETGISFSRPREGDLLPRMETAASK